MIKLNVGGTTYATSSMTLCKYPDSMLARMVDGDFPTTTDENGALFIDRYATVIIHSCVQFHHIFKYLGTGEIFRSEQCSQLLQVHTEIRLRRLTEFALAACKILLIDLFAKVKRKIEFSICTHPDVALSRLLKINYADCRIVCVVCFMYVMSFIADEYKHLIIWMHQCGVQLSLIL